MRESLLLLLILAVHPMLAQNTWNGLVFGSSPTETRELLAKQGLELLQRSGPNWTVKSGWDPFKPLHFGVDLHFSDSGKLDRIYLGLEESPSADPGTKAAVRGIGTSRIWDRLVGTYGKPASEAGDCAGAEHVDFLFSPNKAECRAIFRANGQTVTLSWWYHPRNVGTDFLPVYEGGFDLGISYAPLQSGGF